MVLHVKNDITTICHPPSTMSNVLHVQLSTKLVPFSAIIPGAASAVSMVIEETEFSIPLNVTWKATRVRFARITKVKTIIMHICMVFIGSGIVYGYVIQFLDWILLHWCLTIWILVYRCLSRSRTMPTTQWFHLLYVRVCDISVMHYNDYIVRCMLYT